MDKLNNSQIKQIREDIRNGGINMPDLAEDLLDHFCCTIEYEMEQGSDFPEAYHQARRIICPEGLHKVQQDTLHLMHEEPGRMLKRLMFGSGFLVAFTFLIASLFRMLHWPVGDILMFANGGVLFGVFLPTFLIYQIRGGRKKSSWEKLTYILGTATSAMVCAGTLFKLLHWPGANILLILGIASFAGMFLPLLFTLLYRRSMGKEVYEEA